MEDLYNISFKIKNDQQVGFLLDDFDTFLLLEKFLLKNNYHWYSMKYNVELYISYKIKIQNNFSNNNKCIVFLNYEIPNENRIIVFSMDNNLINKSDIYLNKLNFNKIINNIFNIKPNYDPKSYNKRIL